MNTFKRLAIAALSVLFISSALMAQESTSTLRRTSAAERNRAAQNADGPTVSDRLQTTTTTPAHLSPTPTASGCASYIAN